MSSHPITSTSRRSPLGVAQVVLAMLLAAVVATPSRAQSDPAADWDEDGVVDAADACPDTDLADLTGPDGCTIVSCELGVDAAGWSSHRAYMVFVAAWAKGAKKAGTIDARDARTIVRRAQKSTCGDPELVRCCVFTNFDDEVGRCRIMTENACDALDDRLFDSDGEADSEDAGSCLPNPCTF